MSSPLSIAPDKPAKPRTETAGKKMKRAKESFRDFLERYTSRLRDLFEERFDANEINKQRGLPPTVLNQVREVDPLTAYIPKKYGGRGTDLRESLAVLEASGYQSLGLCLLVGINGGLFLHAIGKYGTERAQRDVFGPFLREKRMGGLMITEPDHGTDALNMKTAWQAAGDDTVHVQGTKHWGGLTGWADYWLLTAREKTPNGKLRRDIDFFVCDVTQPNENIDVEELFPNLGLRILPYGRNKIDAKIPAMRRLQPESTGIKMLLDLLHRSRFQFSGMGMGYLRRIFEEARTHCRERFVGKKALADYDQVKARLARMQTQVTGCAAMCHHAAENARIETNLAGAGLAANAIKSTVTDWMQESAQSFLQLMGAQGFREDHLAGRSVVDSRPYQIFEGSNDVLYAQVAEAVAKGMRRMKSTDLYQYLTEVEPSMKRAAESFKDHLRFKVERSLPQRKMVELGKALSRIFSMEITIELGERDYSAAHIHSALDELRLEVNTLLGAFRDPSPQTALVDLDTPGASWLPAVR